MYIKNIEGTGINDFNSNSSKVRPKIIGVLEYVGNCTSVKIKKLL